MLWIKLKRFFAEFSFFSKVNTLFRRNIAFKEPFFEFPGIFSAETPLN